MKRRTIRSVSRSFRRSVAAVIGVILPAGAQPACSEYPVDGVSVPAGFIALYPLDRVPAERLDLTIGSTVEIRWTADVATTGLRLVYFDIAGATETELAAAAPSSPHTWVVPATLVPAAEYEIRGYDLQGGVLRGKSPAFLAVAAADAGSNGAIEQPGCTSDEDCDDLLFCNGLERCVDSVCTSGLSPCRSDQVCTEDPPLCAGDDCLDDDDCPASTYCLAAGCGTVDVGSNDLQGLAFDPDTGDAVDFGRPLTVGDVIELHAPGVPAGPPADPPVAPPAAAAAAPLDCACAWGIDPATAGTYTSAAACGTELTASVAGVIDISVEVTCGGEIVAYAQRALVRVPPPPRSCVEDANCESGDSCVDGVCAVPPPPAPSIEVLEEHTFAPFVVRFDLRLKDAEGNVIPDGVTGSDFRVLEDGALIDLSETNQFVTAAPNLPLRMVLVLDYTNSMSAAGAIGAMVDAAREFIEAEHFTGTHQIGVVEFHDRTGEGAGFGAAVPLTSTDAAGKVFVTAGIPEAGTLESGLSRVWDAVELAVAMLAEQERQIGEVRAIVFLTDGRDTSSETDSQTIAAAAVEGAINLYPIGFGDVAEHRATLQSLAEQTGGAYFPAADAQALQATFGRVALDLRGQWNLTYITQRNSGLVEVRVEFDWRGQTVAFESSFDAAQLNGDIHHGVIEVLNRIHDPLLDRTSFLLKALYVPRNVDRLSFRFAHTSALLVRQQTGGLIDPGLRWTMTTQGNGYLLSGVEPLGYGAFGNIGVATVPGDVPVLQVTHDDTIYDLLPQAKSFGFQGELWALPYKLEVSVSPPQAGSVTIYPSKADYGHGEIATLTAVPAGTIFDHWAGDVEAQTESIDVVMDSDKTVTAVFTLPPPPED